MEQPRTVTVDVIAPQEVFWEAKKNRLVTIQEHNDDPNLVIVNYSREQQYRNVWDGITKHTRGLIFRRDTGEIIARPFEKFFNHDDTKNGAVIDPTGPVEVFDKLDGSLGVLYVAPDGEFAVSTRGHFHSWQAKHATEVYRTRYAGTWDPHPDYTFLFEIIFPDGKIILDYDGMDDLVLLGAVHKETGRSVDHDVLLGFGWTGPVAERFAYDSFQDVFTAPQPGDREGFIVRFVNTDQRVKVKFAEYLRIHKLFFSLSKIRIWEMLRDGQDVDAFLMRIPDEFTDEARRWKQEILEDHHKLLSGHEALARDVVESDYPDRVTWFKALTTEAKVRGLTAGMVTALLEHPYEENPILQEKMWRRIRPKGKVL